MKNMKWAGGVFALLVLIGVVVLAQYSINAGITNSAHDFSAGGGSSWNSPDGTICEPCHTPHQPAAMNKQPPLWSHQLSGVASYGVYDSAISSTMNASPTDVGGAAVGSASVTALCLSCHDGTVALENYDGVTTGTTFMATVGTPVGRTNLGNDLEDDHPVNFTYDGALATADGELVTPASANFVDAGSTVPLFGGTVQCATCHDPHNTPGFANLLIVDNTASALCLTCHQK